MRGERALKCYTDETGLNGQQACIALGMFDGVHMGHVELLKACVDRAIEDGVPSFVYTYSNSPHPRKQREVQGLLTTTEEKLSLCEGLGIQGAIVRVFTPMYGDLSPEEFAGILFEDERVSTLVCGQNYRFGNHGKGDAALLSRLGQRAGKRVVLIDDLMYMGSPVSSTRVRNALLAGDCRLAAQLLGRPYTVFITIRDRRAEWPLQKARIGEGSYICTFLGKTITVTIQGDGGILIQGEPPANYPYGTLAFIRKA